VTTRHAEGTARPRFFFVHVMRTGGTTFEQQLRRSFPREAVYPNPDRDFPEGDVFHHLELSYLLGLPEARRAEIELYYGHFPFVATEMLGTAVVTITLLREPVERTISLLRVMRERRAPLQGKTLEQIYDDAEVFPHLIHNHQTKLFSMTAADKPKSYLDDIEIDGTRLERATRTLERVDVIGLTERYAAFLDLVRGRYGWRLEDDARMNAAVEEHDEPDHLRSRIASDNAIDIELYRRAREIVERRGAGG
jgi:hypothetical protein